MSTLTNRQILLRRTELLRDPLSLPERKRILRNAAVGNIPYMVALALAPLSAYATLILTGILAAFYALPIASGGSEA